jgi:chromosome segregation ATPase
MSILGCDCGEDELVNPDAPDGIEQYKNLIKGVKKELADLNDQYTELACDMERSKKMCNFYMGEYRKMKKELAECKQKLEIARDTTEYKKAQMYAAKLEEVEDEYTDFKQLVGEVCDEVDIIYKVVNQPETQRFYEIIYKVKQALKEAE